LPKGLTVKHKTVYHHEERKYISAASLVDRTFPLVTTK
jgi:hypothetical protein